MTPFCAAAGGADCSDLSCAGCSDLFRKLGLGAAVVQGILIAILVGTDAIKVAEDGANLQNLLICLEMLPASLAMFYAFPHTEYKEDGACPPPHLHLHPLAPAVHGMPRSQAAWGGTAWPCGPWAPHETGATQQRCLPPDGLSDTLCCRPWHGASAGGQRNARHQHP